MSDLLPHYLSNVDGRSSDKIERLKTSLNYGQFEALRPGNESGQRHVLRPAFVPSLVRDFE